MNKLSTGLRINNAADDAAGLSISEKMRGQIRGLKQAQRNVQDGISLVQVVDGGLGEIMSPTLQRMRELVIQSANSTLTESDRQAIQNEINELKKHIDDIAMNTDFNGIKPLNIHGTTTVTEIISTEVEILVEAGQIAKAGVIKVPNPPNPDELWIQGEFGNISGAEWPDLVNIESPNGEKFGFDEAYLNNGGEIEDTNNNSSSKATYTGWASETE